jgi:hypothetical protein
MDRETQVDTVQMVMVERDRLVQQLALMERDRDNLADMLDDLIIRLKEHGTDNCPCCSDFQDDIEDVFRRVPDVMKWWKTHQGIKAEEKETQRIDALDKLTRADAVALGIAEQWDDLALVRHMEE